MLTKYRMYPLFWLV